MLIDESYLHLLRSSHLCLGCRGILEGDQQAHASLKLLTYSYLERESKTTALNLAFYRLPAPKRPSFDSFTVRDLQNHKPVLQAQLTSSDGEIAILETKEPHLKIEWDPMSFQYDFVLCHLKIEGTVSDTPLSLETDLITAVTIPKLIEFGQIKGEEQTLVLTIEQEMLLPGGEQVERMILKKDGSPLLEGLRPLVGSPVFQDLLDPKTGKVFQAFLVPKTFTTFIGPETRKDSPYDHLEEWDPRVIANQVDQVVDLRKLVTNSGLTLDPDDFVITNRTTNTVYASARAVDIELLHGIIVSGCLSPPSNVETVILVVEGDQPITTKDLNRSDLRLQSRIAFLGSEGVETILKNDGSHVNLEAWLPSEVETRITLDLSTHDGFKSQSTLTTKNDRPEFMQGYQYKGKWRAVFVKSGFQWVR